MATRRSQGVGSLAERPPGSGRWQWRMRLGADPVTGEPQRITRSFDAKTRAAAERQVRKWIDELEAEPLGSGAPMSALFTEWLRHIEARGRSPRTVDSNRRAVEKVLNPAIGKIPISSLSAKHLDNLYDQLLAKPLSPSTVRRHHAVVSAALNQAVKWGWVDVNEAMRASVPESSRKSLVLPKPEEIQQIVSALQELKPAFGMAAFLAAATGARRGELCALQWKDYRDGVLDISASLYRLNGETGIKGTKTGRERLVPVVGGAQAALATWRTECEAKAAEVDLDLLPEAYILSSWPDGSRPINPESLSSAFSRTAKALGLSHVHLHSLRHFAATEMMAAGVSPRDTADVLGHASPVMTLNVYAHSTADRQRAALEAVDRALEASIR